LTPIKEMKSPKAKAFDPVSVSKPPSKEPDQERFVRCAAEFISLIGVKETNQRKRLVPTATGAFVGAAEAASFPADGAHHEKLAASAAPTERLAASAAPARSPDAGLVMAMAVRRRPTGGACGAEGRQGSGVGRRRSRG